MKFKLYGFTLSMRFYVYQKYKAIDYQCQKTKRAIDNKQSTKQYRGQQMD